jgi:hypothetical protein
MNKKLISLLCLVIMVFIPAIAFAQPKLRIVQLDRIPPNDTLYFPNTSHLTYTFIVENVGNNALGGPCHIMFRYDGSSLDTSLVQWNVNNFEVGERDTVTLPADSLGPLNQGRYKGGGNILIIWPQAEQPGTQAPDTTRDTIYIVDVTRIVDPEILGTRVEVFPNPVQDELTIRYLQKRHKIESVRIAGLDGRLVWESRDAVESVDMRTLPKGMYIVVFEFKDGMRGAIRITKPE